MAEYNAESPSIEDQSSKHDLSNIFTTLDDLEKAKTNLQCEYEELLEEHNCAEEKMEDLRTKLNETSQRFMKRQETHINSQSKVDSVVTRAQSMESRCQELRDKISCLQGELEKEKQQQIHSLENFEAQMKELKDLFLKAVSFYKEKGLECEIESTMNQTTSIHDQVSAVESQVKEVEDELSALTLSPKPSDTWEEKLPTEERILTLNMFTKEQAAVQAEVDRLKELKGKVLLDLSLLQPDSSVQD